MALGLGDVLAARSLNALRFFCIFSWRLHLTTPPFLKDLVVFNKWFLKLKSIP